MSKPKISKNEEVEYTNMLEKCTRNSSIKLLDTKFINFL